MLGQLISAWLGVSKAKLVQHVGAFRSLENFITNELVYTIAFQLNHEAKKQEEEM